MCYALDLQLVLGAYNSASRPSGVLLPASSAADGTASLVLTQCCCLASSADLVHWCDPEVGVFACS